METQRVYNQAVLADDPLLPSRRGNQLNGNRDKPDIILTARRTPLSQGKPIEWKLDHQLANRLPLVRTPLSQGKPIEWKHGWGQEVSDD